MTKSQIAHEAEAVTHLKSMLKSGDKVNCILRHVSRSGMRREISLLIGEREISHWAAEALGMKRGKSGGIKIDGCGMDMGFFLVYELSGKLFPTGFHCTGSKHPSMCRATEHFNDNKPYRKGYFHKTDGGYALKHNWL